MAISGGRTLMVYLAADTANFKRNMNQAETTASGFGSKISSLGTSLTNMLGPALLGAGIAAGAMAVKFGVDGVQAFMEDEAAAAKLATTLGNLGFEDATTQVEAMIDAQQRLTGTADDQLRPAFDRLIRSTHDVETATNALKLAENIAAGTGKSLESVAAALGKAYDGNTVGLGKLGIGLDAATLRTGNMKEITKALSETFAGQAETAAGTYQGQIKRLTVGFGELQESFGRGFLGALGNTAGKTDELMSSMKDLEPALEDVGSTIATTVGSLVTATAAVMDFQQAWKDLAASDQGLGPWAKAIGDTLYAKLVGPLVLAADLIDGLTGSGITLAGSSRGGPPGGARPNVTGGMASASITREDPSVIRANLAAQWADVLDKLNPKLEENRTASSGSAKATTSIRDAMKAASDTVNTMFQPALDVAQGALDAVQTASYAYAESLKGAITGTISLASAWAAAEKKAEPGEAFAANALTAFQAQIGDATGFAKAIGNLAAQPGVSQALIDQLVAVGQSQGPIAGTVLANEMISSGLVPELATQLQALEIFAGKTGVVISKQFFDQGTEDAVAMLNGISAEIAAQQKSLKQLGANIGEPIADEVTKQIQRAIRNGLAAGQAEADRQQAAAFALSASSRVTQTAVGQGITAVVRQVDQRTGSLPAAALR